MEYKIVSNVSDKTSLFIEDDMTVGEVRTIIRLMLNVSEDLDISMSYNGKQILQDAITWRELLSLFEAHAQGGNKDSEGGRGKGVPLSRKIFCHTVVRQAPEGASHEALRAAVSGNERLQREQREQARMVEPMIESMAQNPAFVESILNMNPALEKMLKQHPEIAKQMRDPETIKMMMMSQLDPDRRREVNRRLELQLAQILDMPGGQQMLDRYMSGFLRHSEALGPRTEADLHTVSEDVARPDPSKESNSEALPNPWKQPQPNPAGMPTPGPYLPPNPFRMGLHQGGALDGMGTTVPQAPTEGMMRNLMTALAQNPNLAQGAMNMFTANQNVKTNINHNNSHNNPHSLYAGVDRPSGVATTHQPAVLALMSDQGNPNSKGSSTATIPFPGDGKVAYESQLRILKEMGFEDEELCLKALEASNGDVEDALAYIEEHQM